jgi:superfamily II DNA/RNA helicase
VGTPGRLLDHIESNPDVRKQLQNVKVLVLDEADQLLDMGFRKSLDGIIKVLPQQRQTLLFSATVPAQVCMYPSALYHWMLYTNISITLCSVWVETGDILEDFGLGQML